MKLIPLTRGQFAKVSDHRYDYLMQWKWTAYDQKGLWYASRFKLSMHRFIMNAPVGVEVDHIDGDGLNNQDENLRLCTRAQNAANRKMQVNNKSGYKGVCWKKAAKKWVVQINYGGKRLHIGAFDDIVLAAKTYDEAAKKYYGEFASLNFPVEVRQM